MRFARLARKFEGLQFGHRFLSNWMNCLGVIVQSVLKDFFLEDSIDILEPFAQMSNKRRISYKYKGSTIFQIKIFQHTLNNYS